jgi:hypothetical protein
MTTPAKLLAQKQELIARLQQETSVPKSAMRLSAYWRRSKRPWTRLRTTDSKSAKGYRRSQFEAIWHSYCAEDGTTAHSSNIRTLLLARDGAPTIKCGRQSGYSWTDTFNAFVRARFSRCETLVKGTKRRELDVGARFLDASDSVNFRTHCCAPMQWPCREDQHTTSTMSRTN